VTDGETDGQTELPWHIRAIAYMLSRVKNANATADLHPCLSNEYNVLNMNLLISELIIFLEFQNFCIMIPVF